MVAYFGVGISASSSLTELINYSIAARIDNAGCGYD
jgi:hypothetical protein